MERNASNARPLIFASFETAIRKAAEAYGAKQFIVVGRGSAAVTMPNDLRRIADIEVTGSGYLMLACNYDYQGNASGDWQKDVWDASRFQEKGWRRMKPSELGGLLVKGDNREQIVFVKRGKEGDRLRIRCNKADPPFPILVAPPSIQQVSAAGR